MASLDLVSACPRTLTWRLGVHCVATPLARDVGTPDPILNEVILNCELEALFPDRAASTDLDGSLLADFPVGFASSDEPIVGRLPNT